MRSNHSMGGYVLSFPLYTRNRVWCHADRRISRVHWGRFKMNADSEGRLTRGTPCHGIPAGAIQAGVTILFRSQPDYYDETSLAERHSKRHWPRDSCVFGLFS